MGMILAVFIPVSEPLIVVVDTPPAKACGGFIISLVRTTIGQTPAGARRKSTLPFVVYCGTNDAGWGTAEVMRWHWHWHWRGARQKEEKRGCPFF